MDSWKKREERMDGMSESPPHISLVSFVYDTHTARQRVRGKEEKKTRGEMKGDSIARK